MKRLEKISVLTAKLKKAVAEEGIGGLAGRTKGYLARAKKEKEFQLRYETGETLYLAKGYGRQMSGGYSIQVTDLSASVNAVFFETKLIGPTEEVQGGEPSYPYIVVKTEYRDVPVQFQRDWRTEKWNSGKRIFRYFEQRAGQPVR